MTTEIEEISIDELALCLHLKKGKKKKIIVGMNVNFLELVDSLVLQRMGLSRNAWILEAIQEKIERDG